MRAPVLALPALLLLACGGAPASSVGAVHAPPLTARLPLRTTPDLVEQPSASPLVTIRVAFDAGSADDGEHPGATLLAARLMAEGGTEALTFAELSARLFPMAAELDAEVGRDQTVFVGRVHRDHLEAFYGLFRDVLARPRMADADFDRLLAKTRSELELELRGNDDEALGKEALQAMLYEGHPFGHPVLGTSTGLLSLDRETVRAHRARVFCAGRASVGVAGGYPPGFGERVRGDVATLTLDCAGRAPLPSPAPRTAPRVWLVDKPDAESVAVSAGFPIEVTRAHPDYPALMLATTFFGQHRQFVGRLMETLRAQRGLNYGDYAYAEHFEQEGWGVFPRPNLARRAQYFSIWLRPLRPAQAHFAIRAMVRELHRLVERGLTQEELDAIREFATGYYALFLQTESRRLGFALDDRYYGMSEPYLARLRAAWAALTVDELNAVIRRHLDPARLELAIVTSNAAAFADALASDAPSPIEYPAEVAPSVLAEDREIIAYRLRLTRDQISIVPVGETFR